jgi:hypothetical protein
MIPETPSETLREWGVPEPYIRPLPFADRPLDALGDEFGPVARRLSVFARWPTIVDTAVAEMLQELDSQSLRSWDTERLGSAYLRHVAPPGTPPAARQRYVRMVTTTLGLLADLVEIHIAERHQDDWYPGRYPGR